jgi:hypothetical protein
VAINAVTPVAISGVVAPGVVAGAAAFLVDRVGVHDDATPVAVLTRLRIDLEQPLTDPLTGHLHQPE